MSDLDNLREHGYAVFNQVADQYLLYDFSYSREFWDFPESGYDKSGELKGRHDRVSAWSMYKTEQLCDNAFIHGLRKNVDLIVSDILLDPICYAAECEVVGRKTSIIKPRLGSPHNYTPWNQDARLLGVQIGIPVHSYADGTGNPAFLPASHKQSWDTEKCEAGDYTDLFLRGCDTPIVEYGDIVVWDTKTLRSNVSNTQDYTRFMIVLTYLEEFIIDDVMHYESNLSGE